MTTITNHSIPAQSVLRLFASDGRSKFVTYGWTTILCPIESDLAGIGDRHSVFLAFPCECLEVAKFFTNGGYTHYAERFVELGYDSWQSVELMDRDDFLACGVKLGHVKFNYHSLLQQYQTLQACVLHSSPRTLRLALFASCCIYYGRGPSPTLTGRCI